MVVKTSRGSIEKVAALNMIFLDAGTTYTFFKMHFLFLDVGAVGDTAGFKVEDTVRFCSERQAI